MPERPVIIATRGSKLALFQSQKVKERLEKQFPRKTFRLDIIRTRGDQILDVALSRIGDRGIFTKELDNMLIEGKAMMAVHSLKDIPTILPEDLVFAAVLERGDVRDAIVSVKGRKLSELDETDIIATSSLRRKAQLLNMNSKLRIVDIRGNVDTRLRKMDEGLCTAMIMAAAGLQRSGYGSRISEIIDPEVIVPAVSQGAIAIVIRNGDKETELMAKAINDTLTFNVTTAERAFLNALEGGCQIPIGCYSLIAGDKIKFSGFISDIDGSGRISGYTEGNLQDVEKLALELARRFIASGADELVKKIRTLAKI